MLKQAMTVRWPYCADLSTTQELMRPYWCVAVVMWREEQRPPAGLLLLPPRRGFVLRRPQEFTEPG